LAGLLLMLFLFSCAGYNARIARYYEQVTQQRYEKAYDILDNTKLLRLERNRLLYLLEKGKMAHLLHQYDSSNRYFNEADLFIEDARVSAKDIALGTLLNPMMQTYRGEDFENSWCIIIKRSITCTWDKWKMHWWRPGALAFDRMRSPIKLTAMKTAIQMMPFR
jgi:hypothetical protein